MAKRKTTKGKKEIRKEKPFLWHYKDQYSFIEIRDPMYVPFIAPLIEEFMERTKEAKEGYTAREVASFLVRALALEDQSVRLFVIVDKDSKRYVGFGTVLLTSGPPNRAWLDKMLITKSHSSIRLSGIFLDFIEDWCREVKIDRLYIMTQSKAVSKRARKREGYNPLYIVLRKDL